jgi:hypothetical protein
MSDTFKKFVTEHRSEFDAGEPGEDLLRRIDAQMELKDPSQISSSWLSRFKYLGFSASVLVVAVFMITKSSANSKQALTPNKKNPIMNASEEYPKTYQNGPQLNTGGNSRTKAAATPSGNRNRSQAPIPALGKEQGRQSKDPVARPVETNTPDQGKITSNASVSSLPKETGRSKADSVSEEKQRRLTGSTKTTTVSVPEESMKMNTYSGTICNNSSFCTLLQEFRFSGKIGMDGGQRRKRTIAYNKSVLKTISCSGLDSMKNINAIWLKGRTDKKITISIKKGFKNMVLVKKDGRELHPEAISHYYKGRFVISEYKGRYMNMMFTDKVELILFFKDAEEGDKIVIDGTIEAVIKDQP